MSVSIGLLGEGFSIVAVDTRVTHIQPRDGKEYSDNAEKMFQAKFGWIGESGGVMACTTRFQEYLASHDIKTKRHIYIAWLSAIKQVEEDAKKYFPDAIKELSNTQTICSLNYFKDGILNMEIEVIDFAYKLRKLNDKNALFVSPPKHTKRIKRLITRYEEKVKWSGIILVESENS